MPRPSQHRPQGPSQRQLRVAEEIRRTMVEIFNRAHWREPVLLNTAVTVTAARISPDLKNATIFCMPLGGAQVDEVIAALNRSRGYLRGELGRAINLRHVPDLRFAEDRSFEEAQHIEELLRTERVRRDIAAKAEDEQE